MARSQDGPRPDMGLPQCLARRNDDRPGAPGETGKCGISTRNIDVDMPTSLHAAPWMAGIAQLVERQVVVLDVTGSSPVARPTFFL